MEDGHQIDITFSPKAKAKTWDLKIVDEEGDEVEWSNLRLNEVSKITLHYENGQPTADLE